MTFHYYKEEAKARMVSGGHPPAKLPEGKKGDARDQAGKDLLNHSRILQVLLNKTSPCTPRPSSQAKDESLRKMADRIQARAIRRCGELLKQIEPSKGGDASLFIARDGADPSVTRKLAAEQAGLSERQRKTALLVANVPEQDFNQSVESDNPPTVTKLAETLPVHTGLLLDDT